MDTAFQTPWKIRNSATRAQKFQRVVVFADQYVPAKVFD